MTNRQTKCPTLRHRNIGAGNAPCLALPFDDIRRKIPTTAAMPTRYSLSSLLADFDRYSGDDAVVQRRGYRREAWTYARLRHMAGVCAYQLRARGAGMGDRILIYGPNSAEWMAAFWGC